MRTRFAPPPHSADIAHTQRAHSTPSAGIAPDVPVNDRRYEAVHIHETTGGVEQDAGSVLPPEGSSLRRRVRVIVGIYSRREGDAEEMVVEGTAAHELEYEAAVRAVE